MTSLVHLARRRWLWAAATLLAAALATPAVAEDPGSVEEQILEILRDEGKIDQERYEELRRQAQEEAEAAQTAPAVSAATPSDWDFGWKNSFYLKKADGSVELKFGGRIQLDGAVINVSNNLDRAIGGGGDGAGVEFRRARIFAEGDVYEYGIFKAQYDFAPDNAEFKDVYVGLQKLPGFGPTGNARVGHMKEPFSIDELTSSKYITFMERSLTNVFAPSRNTGVMFQRTFADEHVYLGVGGFANANNFGDSFQNMSNYNVTARLTGLPIYADGGKRLLHVGLQYSHQFRGGGATLRYRERPESHLSQRLVDTGVFAGVSDVDLVGGELAGVFGPMHFQAEGVGAFVQRGMGQSNPSFWGAYGQVGTFLTGETRAYDPKTASFKRTSPKQNFSIANGTWGAWEVAGRYSYLDLDSGGIRGGTLNDLTAGLNWYLFPNLRLMANYVYSWRHGAGNASIVQGRVSFDF